MKEIRAALRGLSAEQIGETFGPVVRATFETCRHGASPADQHLPKDGVRFQAALEGHAQYRSEWQLNRRVMLARMAALVLLVPAASAWAEYVVGDVCEVAATSCESSMNGATLIKSPVVVDTQRGKATCGNRVCRVDIAALPPATYQIQMRVISDDHPEVWDPSPFSKLDFARTGVLAAPAAIRLVP